MAPSPVTPADGVAWITGASSGIGRAVAQALARAGWTVVASARRAEALDALAAETDHGPGRIVAAPCDVTDKAQVGQVVADTLRDHGPVALAILNAGTFRPESLSKFDSSDFGAVIDLNVMGTIYCLEALLPDWIARRRGQLAIVSSVAGYRGLPTSLSYGASKAALINLCEALRFDFQRYGLTIQLINPGFVKTPLTDKNTFPMPFLVDVDVAARRIVRGLRGRGFEIAFPWPLVFALKRLRTLPYWLYFPLVGKGTSR